MTNPDSVDASTSCQKCISANVPPIFCNSLALSDAAVWWTNSSMMQQCFGKYEPREGKQLVQLPSLPDMGVSLPRDKKTSVCCWSYMGNFCY